MKLSERIRKITRDGGWVTLDKWADEVAELEAENERLREELASCRAELINELCKDGDIT